MRTPRRRDRATHHLSRRLTDTHRDLLINQRDSLAAAEHFAYLEIEYSNTSEAVAEQLAQNDAPTLRAFSAASTNLSSRVRARLAADMSDTVRLASNSTLDDTQLKRLCEDTNREVVFAAEETYTRRLRERSPEQTTPTAETPREAPRKRAKSKPALFKKIVNFFGE